MKINSILSLLIFPIFVNGQSQILVGLGRYAENNVELVNYPSGVGSGATCEVRIIRS